jgi:hypothetical protein
MKNKKIARKLRLNKETVVNLDPGQMSGLFGGKVATVVTYDPQTVTGGCLCLQQYDARLLVGENISDNDCNE